VALGIIGFVAFQLFSAPPPPDKVTIPQSLAGQPQQVVRNTLIAAQLRVPEQVELAFSETVPKDSVISTNPPLGSSVDLRSTVTLTVSKGPAKVQVPNLLGKSEAEAKALLEQKGLKLGNSTQADTDDATLTGKVIKSDPSGGDEVAGDSSVNIQIGAQPTGDPLDDYSGRRVEDVENDLQSKGYKTQRANSVNDDDTVTATNPPAGSRVPDGGTVTILTSSSGNGQGTQRIPSVTGQTESQARNQLTSAGFTNIRVQRQQVSSANQNGRVIQQSPGGGQNADTSTQVTIVIGQFGNGDGLFGN